MRPLKFCLTALVILFSFAAYSQKHSSLLTGRDAIIDSLRKAGIPETDLAAYSKYLFHKKYVERTPHTHSVMHVDSNATCYNPDFELGNLTNWTGYTGNCCPITTSTGGIVLGRHTIMSGTGTDPWSQGDIPVVAPGNGDFTVRLGNSNTGSEAEKLVHTFLVTPQTTSFTYQYAVVLQDPAHEQSAQPRFEVKVFDSTGTLTPCGYYQVTAAGTIPGFISVGDIRYKKWTTVGVDLSAYVGQHITIEFTTGDCSYGGHFGYAYIDATCEPLKIRKKFCLGDSVATLIAPDGFDSYNWSTGHNTQSITINHPQDGDTIWAYLTSVTGCPTSLYAVLIQEEAPTVVTAGNDTLICPGDSVHLFANGATDYAWSISGTTDTISYEQYPTVNPMLTTTYVATVSNACGFLRDSVLVQVKPYTPLIASADTILCLGLSAPLSATGNANCTWTPATGLSCTTCTNPIASPAQTTMYHVSAIDTTSGCLLTDSVNVQVDSSFVDVYAGADQLICAGTTVYLGSAAIGASSYGWIHTEPISCDTCLDVLVTPATTTDYILYGSNRCDADTDTVTVTVLPIPVADAGADFSICYGDTITLNGTGGVLNTDYQWSPPQSLSCSNCANPTYIVTHNETFYLSVENAAGCHSNDVVNVTIRSIFHSTTADQSICEGQSVILTAVDDSTRALTWFPALSLSCDTCATTIATPTTSTTYTVIGEDTTSCAGIDFIAINVIPLPVANAGPDKDLCRGEYVYLPGSGGAVYQWYPVQDLSCPTCSNPQVNPDSTITYYMIASNICGADTDDVTVVVHQLPLTSAGTDQQICTGLGTSLGATGASIYFWAPSTNLSCIFCASPSVINVGSDITYTVTGTDAFGCSASDDVFVHALPLPTINAGNDSTICFGTPATLHPSGQLNQALWTSAATLSCSSCSNPVATPPVTTTYTIDVTDPVNNCHNNDFVTISVTQLPVAITGGNQTICNGSDVALSVSGGTTYAWSPSTGLSCSNCTAPIANPTQTTTYTVIASNECGSDPEQVLVTVLSNIPVAAGADQQGCIGENFNMSASGGNPGVTYAWLPSTGLSCTNCPNPLLANAATTTIYTVTALNTNGCTTSDAVTITVDVQPTISIQAIYAPDCNGLNATFINAGPVAQTYAWDFGDGSTSAIKDPSHSYSIPGMSYEVHLTASNGGCSSEGSIVTDKFDLANQLVIPNVFTPNNDHTNDCFEIGVHNVYAKSLLDCGTIDIFDRWGLKVFSGSLSQCWNGLKDNTGKPLSDGTYYYIIDNKQQQNKGFITLSR